MFKETNPLDCNDCVFQSKAFKFLNPEELELVNKSRFEVKYKPGEGIFKQGTACTHVVSFNSGLAKIYLEGYNNKQLIIRLVKPGEFIASPGLLSNSSHYYSISAIENSTVCFIETSVIKSIFKQNHIFGEMLMREIHVYYSSTLQKLINLNQKNMHGRLAEALLYLSNTIYGADAFTLTITKKELADMAGISTESSSRILKDLHEQGYININKKKIEIKDQKYLSRLSEIG
ncbi:MAG: Crp/Fnr family transcriptional regulator [Bacteroidales bacterium]|nr:Crp/Fnr family transcriptional regulator [Bacteroidales bacterium]MCF8404725.1 Crp/Fnr family transcriptional regulator [Bacteroidales bacterium]